MQLGAILLRGSDAEWRENVALFKRMRGQVAKLHLPKGFSTSSQDVEYLLAENPQLTTVILRTEDRIISAEDVERDLVDRGFWDLIQRHSGTIDAWIEVGNEPEMVPLDHWVYRWLLLDTVTKLKPKYPGLKWIASMPTTLAHTVDVLAGDQHGRVEDLYDALGLHNYGHTELSDGGSGDWLNIYEYLLNKTSLPLILSEFGINSPDVSKAEKGRRYLDWLSRQPDRLVAATVFVIGKWEHDRYRVDVAMADVLGSRTIPTPQPEPQPEPEPHMPLQLDHEWFGYDDITAEQIVAAIYAHGQPAYSRAQVETYAASMVYRTREFGLRTLAVAAQSAVETNWLKFDGQVSPAQHNYGGIGADDSGAAGASNPTIDHGVVQMCVHHLAYQLGMPDQWLVELRQYAHTDDRIDDVVALLKARNLTGKVRRIRDYGRGIWATDPDYASKIIDRAREIASQPRQPEQEQPMSAQIPGFVWKPADDDHYTKGRTRKIRGGAQHYTGGTNSLDWLTWSSGEDGESGRVSATFLVRRHATLDNRGWQLVRIEDTPWTTYPVNETTVSIEYEHLASQDIPDGDYEVLAQTWVDIIRYLIERPHLGGITADRNGIKGHREWNPNIGTVCPDGIDVDRIVARVREIMDGQPTPLPPLEDPNAQEFPETGHWVINTREAAMLDYWRELGGVAVCGYPLTGMFQRPGDGAYVQFFENVLLEILPDGTRRVGGLGQRYMNLRQRLGAEAPALA